MNISDSNGGLKYISATEDKVADVYMVWTSFKILIFLTESKNLLCYFPNFFRSHWALSRKVKTEWFQASD